MSDCGWVGWVGGFKTPTLQREIIVSPLCTDARINLHVLSHTDTPDEDEHLCPVGLRRLYGLK